MRAIFGALATIALVAACGGGASTATGAATPAPATSGATAAPAATTAAASARPSTPSFLDFANAAKNAQYKVTYKVTASGGGEARAGEQTWYVKGPLSRFDFKTAEGSISAFDLADGYYTCLSGGGGPATCFSAPKDQALGMNQAAAFDIAVRDTPGQLDPTYQGVQTIAGQSGQCFLVKGAVLGGGEYRTCYTTSGIPLLISTKDRGSEYTMEATAFSTSVSDGDFKLPATPVKLGP